MSLWRSLKTGLKYCLCSYIYAHSCFKHLMLAFTGTISNYMPMYSNEPVFHSRSQTQEVDDFFFFFFFFFFLVFVLFCLFFGFFGWFFFSSFAMACYGKERSVKKSGNSMESMESPSICSYCIIGCFVFTYVDIFYDTVLSDQSIQNCHSNIMDMSVKQQVNLSAVGKLLIW